MAFNKKLTAERFVGETANFFKDIATQLKDNFDQHGQTIIDSSGTVGSLIKLVGQQAIDSYFDKQKDKKLADLGVSCYLQAAVNCAENAIEKLSSQVTEGQFDHKVFSQQLAQQNESNRRLHLYLNPKFNPAVLATKQLYLAYLNQLNIEQDDINLFSREFERNIESAIITSFGDDYQQHQSEVKQHWFNQTEEYLLAQMTQLKRVGLQQNESLEYEQAFGQWFNSDRLDNPPEEIEIDQQQPVEELLNTHFNSKDDDSWQNAITFIIADFGKGKTVFMKHHAAILAENYLATGEGPLPLYFNLNQYRENRYDPNRQLGIIDSCLRQDFKIDISEAPFKDKSFVFLIDSLDESGDLNGISEVIESIHRINKNKSLNSPTHKIIIATRPIDRQLNTAISDYTSKCSEQEHPQFISLYGFKPEQFDNWLKTAISQQQVSNSALIKPEVNSIGAELIQGWQQDDFSAHQMLMDNEVLDRQELVKPLFAYILYQLLCNNISIPANGRVGIYLAFLHYISSRAKFIGLTQNQHNQHNQQQVAAEEHRNRKVLHAIAALWCKQSSTGQSKILAKQDINYTLIGNKNPSEQEQAQLDGVEELKFLSHSYFGHNANQLHFQHQSFAEILLAEYYLKVFLLEALEDEPNVETTRQYLFVGEPTAATMEFFRELINLVVASAVEQQSKNRQTARQLLLPTLGSLATPIFKQKLHSQLLKNDLYQRRSNKLKPIDDLLDQSWPIDKTVIANLLDLSHQILMSKGRLRLTPSRPINGLYNQELVMTETDNFCTEPDIDKWLAIAMGGLLSVALADLQQDKPEDNKQIPTKLFFNNEQRGLALFSLIQSSPNRSIPAWFYSIDGEMFQQLSLTSKEQINFSGLKLKGLINFSSCEITNVSFEHCEFTCVFYNSHLFRTHFENCYIFCIFKGATFTRSQFNYCYISNGTHFSNLESINRLYFSYTTIGAIQLPATLASCLTGGDVTTNPTRIIIGEKQHHDKTVGISAASICCYSFTSLIESAIRLNRITTADITESFECLSQKDKEEFINCWPELIRHMFEHIPCRE